MAFTFIVITLALEGLRWFPKRYEPSELCEGDGLDEEELDIIDKRLHELSDKENELNEEELNATFKKLDKLSEEEDEFSEENLNVLVKELDEKREEEDEVNEEIACFN